jgi:hypothetical protein
MLAEGTFGYEPHGVGTEGREKGIKKGVPGVRAASVEARKQLIFRHSVRLAPRLIVHTTGQSFCRFYLCHFFQGGKSNRTPPTPSVSRAVVTGPLPPDRPPEDMGWR